MTRDLDGGGGVEDGRDPAEASTPPRPPTYPTIQEARAALGLNNPKPEPTPNHKTDHARITVRYQDIRAGMTLLEPYEPGGSGARGPAVQVIRRDRQWGTTGAWVCRDTAGKRINIWPGIAHLYVIGTQHDWTNGTGKARKIASNAKKARA